MKKVLFVLALVAVYGVSIAMTQAPVITAENSTIVVVDDNKNVEKDKKESKAEAKSDAKGCSGEKTAAKAEGCSGKKAAGCSGEKSAKKAEGCDGKKTAEAKSAGGCGGK